MPGGYVGFFTRNFTGFCGSTRYGFRWVRKHPGSARVVAEFGTYAASICVSVRGLEWNHGVSRRRIGSAGVAVLLTSNLLNPAGTNVLIPPPESHRPREMHGGPAHAGSPLGNWPVRFGAADDEVAPAEWCFSRGNVVRNAGDRPGCCMRAGRGRCGFVARRGWHRRRGREFSVFSPALTAFPQILRVLVRPAAWSSVLSKGLGEFCLWDGRGRSPVCQCSAYPAVSLPTKVSSRPSKNCPQ
jgi:hypothetical protein